MREASLQTKFNHYIKARWPKGRSAAFELKIVKGPSMPYSNVQDHQLAALNGSKNDKLVYKIPDAGLGRKPYDSFIMSGVEAYVVPIFWVERQYIHAYLIDIDVWLEEISTSKRQSLTEERAVELASEFMIL